MRHSVTHSPRLPGINHTHLSPERIAEQGRPAKELVQRVVALLSWKHPAALSVTSPERVLL